MESYLQGHGLWPWSSSGTTDAKAKRHMMHYLRDDIFCEEGSADGGCALRDSLAGALKDKMASKMPYKLDEIETLKLKQGATIGGLWS